MTAALVCNWVEGVARPSLCGGSGKVLVGVQVSVDGNAFVLVLRTCGISTNTKRHKQWEEGGGAGTAAGEEGGRGLKAIARDNCKGASEWQGSKDPSHQSIYQHHPREEEPKRLLSRLSGRGVWGLALWRF
jgi:hypothetical protein